MTPLLNRLCPFLQLLYRAEIPYQGTEAHHMGQSPDNKWLVAGGVFASVQGLPQVYFYDIEDDPYHPLYTGNVDPKGSGITDQVVFDSQGRAIITQVRHVSNARWLVVRVCWGTDVDHACRGTDVEVSLPVFGR
jgi:hypothetical protein